MQVLLLDTTEKEGEDNKLYHYCASTIRDGAHSKQTSGAWLELRGVLAAAVGATTAICGEELQSAVLRVGQVGHVGIINLDAVVFVLVLDVSVPVQIVEYFARSSCSLMISLFGFPAAKLSAWKKDASARNVTLGQRLDGLFDSVSAIIEQDFFQAQSLQCLFSGKSAGVNSALPLLAQLALLMELGNNDKRGEVGDHDPTAGYKITARAVFCRQLSVLSTLPSSFQELVSQWYLPMAMASAAEQDTHDEQWMQYEVYEPHVASKMQSPRSHRLICLIQSEVQLVFLLETEDHGDSTDGTMLDVFIRNNQDTVARSLVFATTAIVSYADSMLNGFQAPIRAAITQCDDDDQTNPPFWIGVVVDRVRQIHVSNISVDRVQTPWQQKLFALFVDRVVALQHISMDHNAAGDVAESWGPIAEPFLLSPLKLEDKETNMLFLRERVSESGADISSEVAHGFPRKDWKSENRGRNRRVVHQEAEHHRIDQHSVWIVATYNETSDWYVLVQAPLAYEMVETEVEKMCAFGGYEQ